MEGSTVWNEATGDRARNCDECAGALETLARKTREFEFVVDEYVEQLRVGSEIVKQWADQKGVARVKKSIRASG